MGFLDEYNKLKKKRESGMQNASNGTTKKEESKKSSGSSFMDEYNELKSNRATITLSSDDDIAPVTTPKKKTSLLEALGFVASASNLGQSLQGGGAFQSITTDKEEEEDERAWFKKGALDDGYQKGDISSNVVGSSTDLMHKITTGIVGMGEKAVDALAYIAPIYAQSQYYQNGGAYQSPEMQKTQNELFEKAKKESAEFMAKDLYDESEVAKKLLANISSGMYLSNQAQNGQIAPTDFDYANQLKEGAYDYLANDMEQNSVFGEKSDELLESAGQLLATAGLGAIGVPWWLTTGVTSFGAEAESALNQGATYEEAGVSALISSGAEILTEKISGGISFGGATLDDVLTKHMASVITDKTVRTLTKMGIDVLGEGGEEILSGYLGAIGQKLTYADEKQLKELFSFEDAMDSFIGGAILGGVSSAGNAVNSAISGVDSVTGMTKNEQAVFDKVYEAEIKRREENGDTLTNRQKSQIYDETLRRLEKGQIDIDTIEEVLGGEDYKSYKTDTTKQEELQKEFDELFNMEFGKKSDALNARQSELEKQLAEIKTRTAEAKTRIGQTVSDLALSDRLGEAYRDRANRGKVFEADLTQYTTKQAEMVKKAVDSGILNNSSYTHDFVDMLAKLHEDKGIDFDFTNNEKLTASGFAFNGATVNGFVSKNGVTLNIDSAKSLESVVGHEVAHVLEGTDVYTELQNLVKEYAEAKGEYQSRLDSITELYKKHDPDADPTKELTADLIGDYLFTDPDFVSRLSTEHRNVFQKIFDEIKYLCRVATAGSKEARKLEEVKRAFEKAYREDTANNEAKEMSDTETKYSLREEAPPKETGVAYKVFYVKDGKLYPPMVANPDGADTPIGVWLNADVGTSAPPSKTGRAQVKAGGKGTQGGSGSLAFRPGWHLGDLPRASQFDRVNPETGKKELFPENFVWAEVEYAKDVDYQEEAMSYGYTDNGKFRHAYAGLPKLPENGYYRYRTNPKPDTVPWVITGAMKVNRLLSDAEVNEILEKNGVPAVHRQGGDVGLEKFGFAENGTPTSNPDIRFSLSESVEETKDLVAVHNLGTAQLLKTLELGGFPMPSIAITKDDYSHNEYGEISILFGKETIDPQFFRSNRVYGGDAWTPVYPKIEYEVNDKVQRAISEKYYKLQSKIPSRFDRTAYRLVSDLEDMLNREGGEAGLIESLKNDYGMKQFFLAETSTPVEDVITSTTTEMTESEKEMCQYFLDNARELVESYKKISWEQKGGLTWVKENAENIKNAYSKYLKNVLNFTEEEIHNVLENTKPVHLKRFISEAVKYEETGGVTTKEEYSSSATYEAIDNAVNQTEYEEWLNALLKGVEKSSGIRNNVEYFTSGGNRRSFKALHYENTLENVVKVMKAQDNGQAFFSGLGIWGVSAKEYGSIEEIKADSKRLEHRDASEYSAIKKEFGDRLTEIANKIVDKNHYNQFIAMDNAMDNIVDAVRKSKRPSDIARYLERYSNVQNSLEVAQEIVALVNDISNMPTEYFEAKPQRAVGLDEIATVILPKDADEKLKTALSERNIPYVEYDGTAEDRLAKLNGEATAKDKKFSLSEEGNRVAPVGIRNTYGRDIALESALSPTETHENAQKDTETHATEEIAPTPTLSQESINERSEELHAKLKKKKGVYAEQGKIEDWSYYVYKSASTNKTVVTWWNGEERFNASHEPTTSTEDALYSVTDFIAKRELGNSAEISQKSTTDFAEDYAPLTEEQSIVRDDRQIEDHYFADYVAPETEELYNGNYADHVKPSDPFYEKDIWEVGKDRKQKAYMYENPEVKPFFQQEARYMLGELDNSQKGEKFYNDQLYYDTNGEMGFFGTQRHTSEDIAYLLDSFNYTYKQIAKGLRDIIEDNGKENNAVSKRIEFLLDERLRLGYTDFWFGDKIPPNQDYINLLNSKEITEYNDEAWNNWLRGLSEDEINQYFRGEVMTAPMPTEYVPVEPAPIEDAPMINTAEHEAIRPKPTKEPRMARVKDVPTEEAPVARVLTEEPTVPKRKNRFWTQAMELLGDKGFVFENLAKKTKNRELEGKWNSTRYAEGKAQKLIGEGADGVKALNDIQKEVASKGLTQVLSEYVYHLHNIDRMTLEERYEKTPNKAVFGDNVTADVSRGAVAELERTYPQLKKYAKELYDYNNHLRTLLVDGGVISQETADLWSEMYPHYVPIRRVGQTGLNINVPLDTGRTGVNAPIKRATGGNSDILPLFDTMAQRTMQTYRAVARNRFGVELKNTLGSTVATETANVDGVIDSVDAHEELLQKGKNGGNPTFTVFENGEKVTFEITEDMYDALKPMNETLAYTNPVLNKVSNLHRGVLTEYNPAFLLSNAIKDTQDVLINSQHPARTYANFPSAIKEMSTNGKWYREYLENGGEQNTYFDKQTNAFVKEKSGFKKLVGMPLDAISVANNTIEKLPRLAEYIASRKAGASIDVAMLDSARVTTNFSAGGDLTKFLNRNGATFLNASVQGAMQHVRNVREAKMNGLKGWTQLVAKTAIAGLPAILLNSLLWDDDEEYAELSDYVKQNYYVVAKYGDGQFVRIPKGRALAVIQNAFEQTMNALTGDDEVDLANFLELAVSNLAPNNPIENNILAPIIQVANNETWYGEDLVPTRLQDLPANEQFDESTDAISKWLGEKTNMSPYKINYLLNQYSGGVGDMILPMLTPEAESGDNSLMGNLLAPIKSKFTTDSVSNNQNISDFYDTSDTLTTNAKRSNATDEDVLKNKYFNSISAEMSELYSRQRAIQNGNLSDSQKHYQVRELQKQIDALAEEALNTYEVVNIDGIYATVGDIQYRRNNGEWEKLTDKQIEKQDNVTSDLGITPSEYWSNKEEYDFAYEYAEKYAFFQDNDMYEKYVNADEDGKRAYNWAYENPSKYKVSKVITDDVVQYRQYTSEMSDIRADKDENGKTIVGSAKEKKAEYIFGLDLDYGQKIIMYRMEYDSQADKDTYNADIVEYLDSRDDISYEDMVEILEELDMKVYPNGRVTW